MIEKFDLMVDSEAYHIMHDGKKSWKKQSDFKPNLIKAIRERGKKEGFIPYNNFECSISYKSAKKPNMSKDIYKLLNWYPSLPADWVEGMTVGYGDRTLELAPTNAKYTQKCIPEIEVKSSLEYWQKVMEPRFKVIEYSKGTISDHTKYHVIEENPLKIKGDGKEIIIPPPSISLYRIHTVQRLKDGEIFSIGDHVTTDETSGKIQELKVNPSNKAYMDVSFGSGLVPLEHISHKTRPVDIKELKKIIKNHMDACIKELDEWEKKNLKDK